MDRGWHAVRVSEIETLLESSERGLSNEEANFRLARDGPNEIAGKKKISHAEIFFRQFKDPLVLILLAAVLISVSIGIIGSSSEDLINAGVILIIILLNTIMGYAQERKAEETLEALRELSSPKVTVIRDGHELEIPSQSLVVGDLMTLSAGDSISADGRLIYSANLEIDESSLTGESSPVMKDHSKIVSEDSTLGDRTNMAYSGSTVSRGRGKVIVTATGTSTELGQIAHLVTGESGPTPLQVKLTKLSRQLGIMVIIIAALIMTIGLIEGTDFLIMFLTAISLAVAAIPEGLPAVVTVSLAIGLRRMVQRNALMRRLPAVEALGSATVICSDKTGTLTAGVMNIREVALPQGVVNVTGEGYDPIGELFFDGLDPNDQGFAELLRAGVLCNDATLIKDDRWDIVGDGTEGTLLVLAKKAGIDPEAVRDEFPRIDEEPFDSERKRMTTVHIINDRVRSYTKGASEVILPLCTHVLIDGHSKEMNEDMKNSFLAKDQEMASRALRVLALACGDNQGRLTFLGLVGMLDSPRSEAIEAVAKCLVAGIRIVMITGDHQLTAEAIANEMGIPSPGGSITGQELSQMSDEELSQRMRDVNIFARVAPEHKVRIVDVLHRDGHIVAMTGDGVNDAPALKRADIGIAMGVTGTDVAKESSDMILTDDNFASIVSAVEEGRSIYDNIRKFVSFLLSCNAGEIILMISATLLITEPGLLPFLLPIQILWINLVTDGLPAIALGLEPSSSDMMNRCPQDPNEPPVTNPMKMRILVTGILMGVAALLTFVILRKVGSSAAEARTAAFCSIVLSQLLFAFSARDFDKPLIEMKSYGRLTLAVGISLLLQLAVVYIPVVNNVFYNVIITWEWLIIIPLSLIPLIINEIWKYLHGRSESNSEVCDIDYA
ncbi:MAG: cation-translocating P-type ATPase [Euryarchaeota archaeon]|nr:cation-translocating P-type ATPase [Euryarchaeota archaeon]